MTMSLGPAPGTTGGLQARLQASQAALKELELLREKHRALVQETKDSVTFGKSAQDTSGKPPQDIHVDTQRHDDVASDKSSPSSRGGRRSGQYTSPLSIVYKARDCRRYAMAGDLLELDLTSPSSNWSASSPQLRETHTKTQDKQRGCHVNSTEGAISRTLPASTPTRTRSMSQPGPQSNTYVVCHRCRSLRVRQPGGGRRHSEGCDCHKGALQHDGQFKDPRHFSGTTYSYPSPMHAVLLQYHWTRQSDSDSHVPAQQTPQPVVHVDHLGDKTDTRDLPFIFLSEQTKPENNSLMNLLHTSYSELAENYDTFDAKPLTRTFSDCSKSTRMSQSSEEGYFSSNDSPTSSLVQSNRAKRCSGQSDISLSSTGSEAYSSSTDTLADLPSSVSARSLKSNRISGVDDSWIDCLDMLADMKDTFV